MKNAPLSLLGASVVLCVAGSALAVIPNGVSLDTRIFNDFPDSQLTVTNNFPFSVRFNETNFGAGQGNSFANRHSAWFSTDGGATAHDFGYADDFDIKFSVTNTSSPINGREAGFHADLFGLGFFGALPHNGEIAAFGSILPFHSFGTGLWTPDQFVALRMIYRPGEGDGINPLPQGARPSTIEYMYDINYSGTFVSSGEIAFTNAEGGIPENFTFKLGFGVQFTGTPGGEGDATFWKFNVPAPGAGALLGLAGLVGLRRRR